MSAMLHYRHQSRSSIAPFASIISVGLGVLVLEVYLAVTTYEQGSDQSEKSLT